MDLAVNDNGFSRPAGENEHDGVSSRVINPIAANGNSFSAQLVGHDFFLRPAPD
jgi:hypothetical protein